LSIKDSGSGFDLHLARGHTGMGLASMRERARLLGGDLKLDSSPGSGTTVTAIVPWIRREPIAVPRVVVCDDDPHIRPLLVNFVVAACEVVGQAENGLQALEFARRLHPDVMLLDISMPGFGGLEVAQVLRERFPRMRIIFVTERSEQAYIDHAFALGAQGYVVKSKAASELLVAVREVAAGRLFRSSLN
jgi:CheY-like chemotaxis protein